jgi:hypothetical protein
VGDGSAGSASLLERATTYPYDIPGSCYALACGGVLPLVGIDVRSALGCEVLEDGRVRTLREWATSRDMNVDGLDVPELLLAYGSNASVSGLSRKLADCLQTSLVPVAKATLSNFDVVYSAHLTSYGAVPATLQHSPGSVTTAYVLVTSPAQCGLLRRTEPNYHFAELTEVDMRLELGPRLSTISAVISRHGALTLNGTEVGLAAVETHNRRFPAASQHEVLGAVRDIVAPGADFDHFVLENVRNPELARRRSEELKRTARPFAYESWRVA